MYVTLICIQGYNKYLSFVSLAYIFSEWPYLRQNSLSEGANPAGEIGNYHSGYEWRLS